MFERYAEVALRVPLRKTFTYRIPAELVETCLPGVRVEVELRGRQEEGIVTATHGNAPDFALRDVAKVMGSGAVLTEDQLRLGEWLSDQYLAGIGESLFKMFPAGKRPAARKPTGRPKPSARPELNTEQQAAFDAISADLTSHPAPRTPPVHLLHGITGSSKTEVYIRLILACRELGRSAVLLVPEISLTVQLISRLREVFGSELVLLHSALRKSERLRGYLDLLEGHRHIAVGTRSAVFAPLSEVGLFILDEEHDGSYKEHSSPRYHARQVAYYRASQSGAVMVLGSATPALETRHHAEAHKGFSYHRLSKRATGATLPSVELVRISNPDVPLSGDLLLALEKTIGAGEQALLLLNRRGYYPFQYCPNCEASLQCPNCSVTLNLHRDGRLVCHYCSFMRKADGHCDRCHGPVRKLGSGTQKLEEYLLNLYPKWRIERLDTDSAGRVNAVEGAVNRLLEGELDILLGTQMIAKGLDAPNVTLVGVLQADLGLNMPDFRAGERTFSLLTQVAGRAGRGERGGRVILEVLNPGNPVVQHARAHNYEAYYAEEIELRRNALYPPFCRLIRLLCRCESEEHARFGAAVVARHVEGAYGPSAAQRPLILGPAPAPLERLHGQYRHHVIIKTTDLPAVRTVLQEGIAKIRAELPSDVYLEVDFDPTDLA